MDAETRPGDSRLRAARIVATGVVLALVQGVFEAGYRFVGQPLSPRLPAFGYEFFWVIPAGMVVACAPVILAAALLHAAFPRWVTMPRAVLLVAITPLLALSLTPFRERLSAPTHLLLAVGCATVLARIVEGREALASRVAAVALPSLALIPICTLLVIGFERGPGEAWRLRRLPPAPLNTPNVLVLVWDAVRERDLSLYGYRLETTPNLARWARKGVVFASAYSTAPWTLPSHSGLFTGMLPQHLNTTWSTPLDGRYPTLAEVLASHGFRTAGFTANLGATQRSTGLGRGFAHYEDWPVPSTASALMRHLAIARGLRQYRSLSWLPFLGPYLRDARDVTDSFLHWLDRGQSSANRPYFAFLNYFNAHGPYIAPASFRRRFPGDAPRTRYDAAIAYQDAELDRLFGELQRRGLLDNTVIVFTSDHGESLGDHGYAEHGNSLYVEQLHVPLVIWAPRDALAGRRIEAPVSLRDVAATLVELALGTQTSSPLGGRPLSRHWTGAAPGMDTVVAGGNFAPHEPASQFHEGNGSSLIVGTRHYILEGSGEEHLFDLRVDAREVVDLAGEDSLRVVLDHARAYLTRSFSPEWTGPLEAARTSKQPAQMVAGWR